MVARGGACLLRAQPALITPSCFGRHLHQLLLVAPVTRGRSCCAGPGATSATRHYQCNKKAPVQPDDTRETPQPKPAPDATCTSYSWLHWLRMVDRVAPGPALPAQPGASSTTMRHQYTREIPTPVAVPAQAANAHHTRRTLTQPLHRPQQRRRPRQSSRGWPPAPPLHSSTMQTPARPRGPGH